MTRANPVIMVRAASGRLKGRDLVAGVEGMADDARGEDNRDNLASDEGTLSARLRDLGKRIERHHSSDGLGHPPSANSSAMARGFRLSSELVAGVLLGGAIGWLLDHWLRISPWGMIVFVLLGFAAGVLNLIRAAGVIPPNRLDPPQSSK